MNADELMSVETALARAVQGLAPGEIEPVPLTGALGRVLARDVVALRTQPPQAASAMDGYAVRHADVTAVPARLQVVGAAPAGHPHSGEVRKGQAVRIFTGGVVPNGADTVVIQEDTETDGDTVMVLETPVAGQYVRPEGLDFREGDTLLIRNRTLGPSDIALAAAMNHASLPVRRQPEVAILATGDELVEPGDPRARDLTVSSNSFGLFAMVEAAGARARNLGIAPDDAGAIASVVAEARGADIVVTLGGASVGEHDLVRAGLDRLGLELDFWRIAMRPGKPLMHGRLGAARFLGLPGNPVSAMVCGEVFLRPMLRALLGLDPLESRTISAILGRDLPANDRRQDYLRATVERNGTNIVASPFDRQDSSMLAHLQKAGGLVIRPPHAPPAKAGDTVDLLPLKA